MPFPDFEPTVPVFIRTVSGCFADRELIALNDRRITFRDADALSAQLARGLLASGIGKGTRVGLLMPNGPEFVIAFLAAARIGALVLEGRRLRRSQSPSNQPESISAEAGVLSVFWGHAC